MPPRRWLIGHSGGLDSQVLLHLAARHLPAEQLQVIHINHQLQSDARAWAAFSAAQAKQLGLAQQTLTVELEASSENSARDARYEAFSRQLVAGDCLLLGHHADDQAETLLFRLLRGTGLTGLAGIPAARTLAAGQLLRPLLQHSRAQLEQWAHAQQLSWVEDPSNALDDYDRNFLRNRVMPVLAQRWPGFAARWAHTAQLMVDTDQLLNTYLDQDLQRLVGPQQQLNCEKLPVAQPRRQALLRRWLQRQGVSAGAVPLAAIERELIGAQPDAQPLLQLGGRVIRRYRGQLYCLATMPVKPAVFSGALEIGEALLGDGVLTVATGEGGLKTLASVQLVRRQGGERLQPAGRGGHCSLKKLLQEAGIAPWQRASWPLLMVGEEVVAVPGICICENWQSRGVGFTVNWAPL